jgi:predicted kinase
MNLTGSPGTRLVVLRGNSGAGKSTVARLVRAQLRPGPVDPTRDYYRNDVALIEQDYIRRTMLGEHDRPSALNISVIDLAARAALDAGFDVVIEGMLFADRYADMLRALTRDHRGRTRHWYFAATPEVTLNRHRYRPLGATVPAASLQEWYRADDLLPDVEQQLVPSDWSAQHAADRITSSAVSESTAST